MHGTEDLTPHILGAAIEDAIAEGLAFIDWPDSCTRHEIADLRADGFNVRVDRDGVHVRWHDGYGWPEFDGDRPH